MRSRTYRTTALFVMALLLSAGSFSFGAAPGASAAVRFDGMALIEEWAGKAYQGRQAGTPGYAKAADDLEKRMRSAGMLPLLGENQYRQSYKVGTASLKKEQVSLNGKTLKLMKDYMPFARSAEGKYTFRSAYYAGAGLSADYKKKVDAPVVFRWFDKNGKFPEGIQDRVQRAAAQGAKAVLIVTNGELKVGNYEHPLNAEKLGVPVLYLSEAAAEAAGIPREFTPAALSKLDLRIDLSIDRSSEQADNLVGIVPGKSEEKAILWVTNIDGFGSLPDGRWYESAKAGSASAAMMLDMARHYKETKPEYTMIFAFVGSKWKGQEGIKALTDKLSFDRIAATVELYAMGGNGKLGDMFVNYLDKSFEVSAQAVSPAPIFNSDPGNALSSVLRTKTNKLLLVRDRETWVDDSLTDKAANVTRSSYESGVRSLLELSDKLSRRIAEENSVSMDYSRLPVAKAEFQNPKTTLHRIVTRHFNVYADESYIGEMTPDVLKEMDSIYARVAKYNYYPLPEAKVNALFMKDGNAAAKIAGRKDLEGNSEAAGGGFANLSNGQMYIYMRSGPFSGTIAHELNHALATANAYAGDNFELQEWQGQSHFTQYLQPKGPYSNDIRQIIRHRFLANHEVPKFKELVAGYKTALNWSWYTKGARNPDGHLYTYYLMGSMYAFLEDQYGEKAARRAMYRNYIDVSDAQNNLIRDTGLSLNAFLEKWSAWVLRAESASPASGNAVPRTDNNGFDYMVLYTNPGNGATGQYFEQGPEDGDTITNGTVRYSLNLTSPDLKIVSLNLYKTKDGARFEIAYESKINRFVSLFNPPDGDKLMRFQEKAIVAGKGKATVQLNGSEVKAMRELPFVTFRFGEGDDFAVLSNAEYMKILQQ
ncbi:hypothetical protein B1A99_27090 [Cohnella sp. CIP 111063]|uniref:hypothetical protein n=1 Tax=unclassified Cohnella TaxID=2636738 RepID=UPI000B8C237D|nr:MULTISPECIES: hypothetical protein [unclassified Cohnella]OXS54256.1 hypothetical protein B1A99_27090 [Cohnella sp. CIP 111063]PRX63448.1 hypothetical protein B0G52_12172 [Cohnella sp. SGD-V74]